MDVNTINVPEPQLEYEIVIGIGGGKVIDYAKILAGDNAAIAIPTTAAGAALTSHAVFWDMIRKKKMDVPTKKPKLIMRTDFLQDIPKTVIKKTCYDALGHALDSYWSKKRNTKSKYLSIKAHKLLIASIKKNFQNTYDIINAGNIAGEAIEITGTNMTHAISYPLTATYNIEHGIAVGCAIQPSYQWQKCDLELPSLNISINQIDKNEKFFKTIAMGAMSYSKIHDAISDITESELIKLLKNTM